MADEPGLNLFQVRGDLNWNQSFFAQGIELGLGRDRFRQDDGTISAPTAKSGQQDRRQPKPPSPLDGTVHKSFQPGGGQGENRKGGQKHEAIVGHHVQSGQTQQINKNRHIQGPAQAKEREKNPKCIDGAMTPAAPGQRSDQQCGEDTGVSGGGAFQQIWFELGDNKSAALFSCAVDVRQNHLGQRGQSNRGPFLRAFTAMHHPGT